ncbi:porin [bacterium SCSIO 12827]|nr:porin [bacterium SCSIO 12827]
MNLKKTLMVGAAGAALFAFAAPVATTAEAGSIKNGNATDLKVYGQVNRNMMFYNDGEESGYRHQDGDNGSTRFGLAATGKVNESVSVGAKIEVEMQSNDPGSISQSSEDGGGGNFSERHANLYFSHKQFGKLTLGQQSEISDGMSDGLDLGYAAGAFAGMDSSLLVAGMLFRNDNTAAALSTTSIRTVFKTLDGGRNDSIQYETPSMNGFRAQLGLESQGTWGIGGLYDGKMGGLQVRVRGFYENTSGAGTTADQWQLGASVKHDSGISLTGLYGSSDQDSGKDHKVYGATVGYTANMNSLGATGVGVTFQGTSDLAGDGIDGQAFGFGVNQQIKAAGTNIYGNVMFWDVDGTTTALDSLMTFLVGAQVKF